MTSRWGAPIAALLALVAIVNGCSTDREPGELFGPSQGGELVVDAILHVGRSFPDIRLSRTAAPENPFEGPGEGVTGAKIIITGGGAQIDYAETDTVGLYAAFGPLPRVQPETEYVLSVNASGELLSATTTTPPEFHIDQWLQVNGDDGSVIGVLTTFEEAGDSIYAAPANQLTYSEGVLDARFTRPDVVAFQVGIQSLDEDSDYVIDIDLFDDDEDFEDLPRAGASPPFEALDGELRLPWFAIYYEGRYLIRIFAIDNNWYDLIRSTPAFGGSEGFGGSAGGGFDKPLFHIDGGIGIFGSASVDSIGFNVLP